MIFGVFAPQGWKTELAGIDGAAAQWEATRSTALVAEQLGFDSIWVYDHFHNVPRPAHEAVFECWTTIAAISKATTCSLLRALIRSLLPSIRQPSSPRCTTMLTSAFAPPSASLTCPKTPAKRPCTFAVTTRTEPLRRSQRPFSNASRENRSSQNGGEPRSISARTPPPADAEASNRGAESDERGLKAVYPRGEAHLHQSFRDFKNYEIIFHASFPL